jgi:hypothetical protein
LRTDVLSVAKLRLDDLEKNERGFAESRSFAGNVHSIAFGIHPGRELLPGLWMEVPTQVQKFVLRRDA